MKNSLNGWYVASVPPPSWHPNRGWLPCIEWCRQVFGGIPTTNIYMGRGWQFISEGVFEFECEIDRTAFLLRWA